jgi:FkbM family methyltransferase
MGLIERAKGKWMAAGTLAVCVRHFANWREVWPAYRAKRRLPPIELRSGLRLFHGEGDAPVWLYRELFLTHCPLADTSFYRPRPTDTVVDIGANIGFFMLLLNERAPGLRVHCFEPARATSDVLRRNVEGNNLGGTVRVHQLAVSDRRGALRLVHGGTSLSHSFFLDGGSPGAEVEEVETVDLDEALARCGDGPIDLLKIDTEGAEAEIVEGASPSAWARVRRAAVEYHDVIRPGCRDRVAAVLRRSGFDLKVVPMSASGDYGYIQGTRRADSTVA